MSPASNVNLATALMRQYGADIGDEVRIAAFAAAAWYNSIELVIPRFVSFKRRRGCYFWSLLVSSIGVILNCPGYFLLFFPTWITPYICATLIILGWYAMVTGQSVVLWSRLHLVLQNTEVL